MSDIMYFRLTLFPQQSEVIPLHRINRLDSVVEIGCLLRGTNYIYCYHLGWFMCVLLILCQRVLKVPTRFDTKRTQYTHTHSVYTWNSFSYSWIYRVPALSTAAPLHPPQKKSGGTTHGQKHTTKSPTQKLVYLQNRYFVFGIQTTGLH
jgi:hypothetical protein